MSEAICRTCGGTPGNHQPSMFDPDGIGDPGHKMNNPHPSISSEDEIIEADTLRKTIEYIRIPNPEGGEGDYVYLRYLVDADTIEQLLDIAQKKYQEGELKGRIDELSMVQSGHYVAQTLVNGQAMTVEKRINDLESQYKERSKQSE